jgi:hypothetical protein
MEPIRPAPFVLSFSQEKLTQALRLALSPTADKEDTAVAWFDGDSEMVLHLSELQVSLKPGSVLVRLAVETDQTGKDTLIVPFSVGSSAKDAYLIAMTESVPRGNTLLASRWGRPIQETLWHTLLQVGQSEVDKNPDTVQMTVAGLFASDKELSYIVK